MAPVPLLLRAVAGSCLFCLPSAFVPGAVSSVRLQEQRRECPSATTATEIHEQRSCFPRQHHSQSSPGIACSVRRSSNTQLRAEEGGCAASSRGEFLDRVAAGTFAAGGCAAAAVGRPVGAEAFCGEPYPYWAYFTDFDEVFVPFTFEGYSGKLFARTVGNGKEQKKAQHNPLVIIPGGPGLPHDYLETLEGAAKDDRVVVLFDPIGTGNSTALPADALENSPSLLGTASLIAQTSAVVDYFKVSSYHVLGHGTGAEAALELGRSLGKASPRPAGPELEAVLSVTLASPVLGGNELSPDFLETLRVPYTQDGKEPPLCLETAMDGRSADGFGGGLAVMEKDWRSKSAAAVGPLPCPVLITYGTRDVVGDKAVDNIKRGLSGGDAPVEVERFGKSGHLAHLDEREAYVTFLQNYVTSVDESWAGKSASTKK